MLTEELETQIILAALLIDVPCVGWLLYQYIEGKEGSIYWLIVGISGIIIYIIWTLIESPFVEFGMGVTDPYGAESYLPISKIAVSICPGVITVVIIKNIRNIQDDLMFFKYYGNWEKDEFQPSLIAKLILFMKGKFQK